MFDGSQQETDSKSFLSTICDNNAPLMGIMVKSISVDHIDRNLKHLCNEGAHGLLIWISKDNFADVPELDVHRKYLGRVITSEANTEYCSYHPVLGECSSEGGSWTSSVTVLGEKYPERYELRDIVYKKWTNSTRLGSPVLAYGTLKNRDAVYKYIDQDISYLADSRLDYLLPPVVSSGLPLSIYRGRTETYRTVSGETHYGRTFKSINAVHHMSPYTIINVTVIGTETRAYREFRAKLVTIYTDDEGFNWAQALSSIDGASIETSLTETHVEYSVAVSLYPESQHSIGYSDSPETDTIHKAQPILSNSENIHIHIGDAEIGQVYPGFRNIAIGAGILFFSVLGIALLDIIRRVVRDRRAKKLRIGKYKRVNA